MAEPTDAELAALNTIDDAAAWASVEGDGANLETAKGSLYDCLGTRALASPMVIGVHPKADFEAVLGTWKVSMPKDGAGKATAPRAPSFAELGAARLFGVAVRQKAGTDARSAAAADKVNKAHALAMAQATVAITAKTGSSAGPETFKADLVINQSLDKELSLLPKADLDVCYANYKLVFGTFPEPKKECNAMQLTSLGYLLSNSFLPYIDLALWGPYAGRIFKKLKLRGLVITQSGEFQQVEIGGPPTFAIWDENWDCAITGYTSHKAVPLGILIRYRGRIADLHKRFGPGAWALIYQADVRMRSEHQERIRRHGEEERAQALAAGGSHAYDPADPWGWIFEQSCTDTDFWKTEVEDVGAAVADRAKAIGGDAPLAGEHAARKPGPGAGSHQAPVLDPRNAAAAGISAMRQEGLAGPPPPKKVKIHDVQGGEYLRNRAGNNLCPSYRSAGTCTEPLFGVAKGGCRHGSHQCGKCLGRDHGSSACTKPAPPAKKAERKPRFKG
jgi:hypothetical protein